MNNKFEIRGDVTAIFLKRMDGSILETSIDTKDLPVVQSFPKTWFAVWSPNTKSFYVQGLIQGRSIRLHRWVLTPPKGLVVDHINHDTLDNRRSNLRIATYAENKQNLKGARFNSTSGIRGVVWNKEKHKWRARIKINGKEMHIGYFDDIYQAGRAAAAAREKLMPFSLDAMKREG